MKLVGATFIFVNTIHSKELLQASTAINLAILSKPGDKVLNKFPRDKLKGID